MQLKIIFILTKASTFELFSRRNNSEIMKFSDDTRLQNNSDRPSLFKNRLSCKQQQFGVNNPSSCFQVPIGRETRPKVCFSLVDSTKLKHEL